MTAPPGDRGQLDFLQHVQRIFDEGEFVATYKFALLIALVELAIERGDDTGAPLELDLHSIAEKFIEQYWPHAAPYSAADGAPAVLVQNHGRQAAIVARVAEVRGRFGSLAHWVKRNRESGADLAARLSPAGFLDDQPAALQVARWAYRQAEATEAQLWVSLKYTVNADRKRLEILGG